ncbi:unnamed protein product [Urochloa decumbens]|uniref:Uncharacterized protein n=1 Tax=Urochloa decumbens TaxID=240449 RepID=A0ABC9FA20_9POAL
MEARFGRRRRCLGAQPPRGSRRRCPGGDEVDRISGLNDDLSSASAAPAPPPAPASSPAGGATSGGTSPSSSSAASRPTLSKPPSPRSPFQSCAAALLDPVELSLTAWMDPDDCKIAIEVLSFARATSISLDVNGLLHSATTEEVLVTGGQLRGVDIVAPMLKKFTMRSSVHVDFTMSLLAPKVENLLWKCWSVFGHLFPGVAIDGSEMWWLSDLELKTEARVFILVLDIGRPYFTTQVRNLQEMFPLPNISVLELRVACLWSNGVECTKDLQCYTKA